MSRMTALVEPAKVGSVAWHAIRRRAITGTDLGAIFGKDPRRSPLDIYLSKMGLDEPTQTTPAMAMGTRLEPVVAEMYAEATGKALETVPGVLTHPTRPLFRGSPDRLVVGESLGLEIKTAGIFTAHEFGEAGTDEVPMHYLLQCVHYMALTGRERWDLAVLLYGQDFRVYHLERDLDLEAEVLGRAEAWWAQHVAVGVPPEVDGSEAWTNYLKRRFPRHTLPLARASEEADQIARRLQRARLAYEAAELEKQEAENLIKAAIGDAEGLQGDDWKITWKAAKDSTVVDERAVINHLRTELELRGMASSEVNGIILKYSSTRPGSRRLHTSFKPAVVGSIQP